VGFSLKRLHVKVQSTLHWSKSQQWTDIFLLIFKGTKIYSKLDIILDIIKSSTDHFSISHSLWCHIKFMVNCVVFVQVVTILQNVRVKSFQTDFQPSLSLWQTSNKQINISIGSCSWQASSLNVASSLAKAKKLHIWQDSRWLADSCLTIFFVLYTACSRLEDSRNTSWRSLAMRRKAIKVCC